MSLFRAITRRQSLFRFVRSKTECKSVQRYGEGREIATKAKLSKPHITENTKKVVSSKKHADSSTPFDALGMTLNTPLTGARSVIDSIGPTGFTINGVRVQGSVLIMPTYSTLWNINNWNDVSPAALALIKISNPRPDILLLGSGANYLVRTSPSCWKQFNFHRLFYIDKPSFDRWTLTIFFFLSQAVPRTLRKWMSEIGVNIEILDTKNACHTFNVLNQESRNVAAAMLPFGYMGEMKS